MRYAHIYLKALDLVPFSVCSPQWVCNAPTGHRRTHTQLRQTARLSIRTACPNEIQAGALEPPSVDVGSQHTALLRKQAVGNLGTCSRATMRCASQVFNLVRISGDRVESHDPAGVAGVRHGARQGRGGGRLGGSANAASTCVSNCQPAHPRGRKEKKKKRKKKVDCTLRGGGSGAWHLTIPVMVVRKADLSGRPCMRGCIYSTPVGAGIQKRLATTSKIVECTAGCVCVRE